MAVSGLPCGSALASGGEENAGAADRKRSEEPPVGVFSGKAVISPAPAACVRYGAGRSFYSAAGGMIRIAISAAAFEAIARTLRSAARL